MKVLVIGATGLTGGIAVRLLIERGHDVTALARKPALVQPRERLHAVFGEARDAASLERAVQGQDAVLSTFGPRSLKKDDLQEVFMRNLVAAMQKAGVKRLVNLSAWGAGESYASLNAVGRVFVRLLLGNLFVDKNRGEQILFASPLEYVNVRPGRLSNGRARRSVKASLDARDVSPWPLLAREDLAEFMVEQLGDSRWLRSSPLLGY